MTPRPLALAIGLLHLYACGSTPAVESCPDDVPATTSPIEELNSLDPRAPVPLQPMMAWLQKQNMQEHLVAIQRITEALSRDDWKAVSAATSMLALSPQMEMQCEHMGAGADGFTKAQLQKRMPVCRDCQELALAVLMKHR